MLSSISDAIGINIHESSERATPRERTRNGACERNTLMRSTQSVQVLAWAWAVRGNVGVGTGLGVGVFLAFGVGYGVALTVGVGVGVGPGVAVVGSTV